MSVEKQKYPHAEMLDTAALLAHWLASTCRRFAFAGSLRRGAAWVGDIEVVAVPGPDTRPVLDDLLAQGVLRKRLNVKGKPIGWGEENRHAEFWDGGYQRWVAVDFFLTTYEQWGIYFAIRTGDADVSRLLVTNRSGGGLLPEPMMVKDWRLWKLPYPRVPGENMVPEGSVCLLTREEVDVFRFLNLPYIAPFKRYVSEVQAIQRYNWGALVAALDGHKDWRVKEEEYFFRGQRQALAVYVKDALRGYAASGAWPAVGARPGDTVYSPDGLPYPLRAILNRREDV